MRTVRGEDGARWAPLAGGPHVHRASSDAGATGAHPAVPLTGGRPPALTAPRPSAARRLLGGVRRAASDRLVQFVVLGGLIFAFTPPSRTSRDLTVTDAAVEALARADARRDPGGDRRVRAAALRTRYVEDELLYREGLRLGLDTNDGIVRQRVIQRTLALAEQIGGANREPSEAELRAWFEAHRDAYVEPGFLRFRNVFARSPEALGPVPPSDRPVGGLPSPVGAEMAGDLPRVAKTLGPAFAEAVGGLEPGRWSDPVPSRWGWHRVLVVERSDERPATFEEARKAVTRDRDRALRQEAVAAFLQRAFDRYRVTVGGTVLAGLPPSGRTASPPVASGED